MNWNIALQLITLIAAILSPVLVTWLNNRHIRKLEQMKFLQSAKFNIINQFVTSYSRLPDKSTGANAVIYDFISSAYNAARFLDAREQEKLFALINTIQLQQSNNGTRDIFTDCLLALFHTKL